MKKPTKPKTQRERTRIGLALDPELRRRIEAEYNRVKDTGFKPNLSDVIRGLLEAGLEKTEANQAEGAAS